MTISPIKTRARCIQVAVLLLCTLCVVLAGPSFVFASPRNGGVEKWAFSTGNVVLSSPSAVGGVVYVGSGDGKVYALTTK